MRGKVISIDFLQILIGITPAHAGKRGGSGVGCKHFGDHPRTCGEKFSSSTAKNTIPGSPPHMRGKALVLKLMKGGYRITPAHAGKSHSDSSMSRS